MDINVQTVARVILKYILLIECSKKELPWVKTIVNHYIDEITIVHELVHIEISMGSEEMLKTIIHELSHMSIKNLVLIPIKKSETGDYEILNM